MSISFLTVSVVCFWKTSISNCGSLLFYKRLLLYAILSGLDRCCTCNFMLIESCLTMFITTIDITFSVTRPLTHFSIKSPPPPPNFFFSLSVFEYCVQVFPYAHTSEDGAQIAHPIISQTIKSFFSFTASTATIVRNPGWGSSGCLNFVTWSATPHFGLCMEDIMWTADSEKLCWIERPCWNGVQDNWKTDIDFATKENEPVMSTEHSHSLLKYYMH